MRHSGNAVRLLLLFLVLPGIMVAQVEGVVTAREHYEEVRTAAIAFASDVQLIFVESGDVVGAGGSHGWTYFFRSAGLARVIAFKYEEDDRTVERVDNAEPTFSITLHPEMTQIPEPFVDSDAVLAEADANGGDIFRGRHNVDNYHVELFLLPQADGGRNLLFRGAAWIVLYSGEHGELAVPIDAITGAFLDFRHITARTLFEAVDSLAQTLAEDIELIQVVADDVGPDGSAQRWQYFYQSLSRSNLYGYNVDGGRIETIKEPIRNSGTMYKGMPSLPPDWIDSDKALEDAEQSGGFEFRQTHPDWDIMAYATTLDSGLPKWQVRYNSPTGTAEFVADAFSGNPVTARHRLDDVLARSLQEYSDAELVLVRSLNIDPEGRASHWSFVFKSTSKPDIFGVNVLGGEVLDAIEPIGLNGPLDIFMTPLPEKWLDSDLAFEEAEQRGGSDFRQVHNEWNIDAELRFSESGWLEWHVYYTDPLGSVGFVIDGLPRNPVTAQHMLPDVLTASLAVHADAQLVSARTTNLDLEGRSNIWSYIFKSVSQSDLFEVTVLAGEVSIETNQIEPDAGINLDTPALPELWLDSDSALVISEELGGSEFRSTHAEVTIELSVRWRDSPPTRSRNLGRRPICLVAYKSGEDRKFVSVDLVAGPFSDLVLTSARDKLTLLADSVAAAALPDDAKLVYVGSTTVDHTGEAAQWAYLYESPSENQQFEFRVLGGHVLRPDRVYAERSPGSVPISEGWIDSGLAMKVAEQDGGREFRSAHPDYAIMLELNATVDGVFWNAGYGSDNAFEQFAADAMDHSVAIEVPELPPDDLTLQSYPNPFSNSANLAFTLTRAAEVSLVVYDVLGRERVIALRGFLPAGLHTVPLKTQTLEAGLYFFVMTADDQVRRGQMIKVR